MITSTTFGLCLAFSFSQLKFLLSIPFLGSIGTNPCADVFLVDKTFRVQFYEYTFTLLLRCGKEYRVDKDFRPLLFGQLITETKALVEETIKNGDGVWVLEKRLITERYSRLSKLESSKEVYHFKVIPEGVPRHKHLKELETVDAITAVGNYYKVYELMSRW